MCIKQWQTSSVLLTSCILVFSNTDLQPPFSNVLYLLLEYEASPTRHLKILPVMYFSTEASLCQQIASVNALCLRVFCDQ